MSLAPFRLKPWFSERVWGRRDLKPWFAETGTDELVGEAWLSGPQCVVETGPRKGETLEQVARAEGAALLGAEGGEEFPLLVKILFPNDKLSVQVHPDDVQAQAMGQPRGKTECWYALDAEPGAAVALGLKDGASVEMVRQAITDGTMESLLEQVPVTKGDMLFVDAGTVHAIGPGVTLLEVQQTSDTTFRMFDYGRPRELHVEQGLAVTRLGTRAGKVAPRPMDGYVRLIEEQYFVVDRFDVASGELKVTWEGAGCLVGLDGHGTVVTEDEDVEIVPGRAVVVPAGATVMVESGAGVSFVRAYAPKDS